MPQDTSDRLRELLSRKIANAEEAVLNSEAGPNAADIDSLERLSRLLALRGASEARRSIKTWHAIGIAALVLAVLTLLLGEKEEIEVEFDVSATYTSFLTAADVDMQLAVAAQRLVISGLGRVDVPGSTETEPYRELSGDSLILRSSTGSRLQFEAPIVPADSAIELSALPTPNEYGVGLCASDVLEGRVVGSGAVTLVDFASAPRSVDLGGGAAIEYWSKGKAAGSGLKDACVATNRSVQLTVDFLLQEPRKVDFAYEIPVKFLSFERPVLATAGGRFYSRTQPSIEVANMKIHSLKGQSFQLDRHQRLSLGRVEGVIRNLRMNDGLIRFSFLGTVGGMVTGSESNVRSLMPTRLEWLLAQDRIVVLWGTFVSAFSLLWGVLKWWAGT